LAILGHKEALERVGYGSLRREWNFNGGYQIRVSLSRHGLQKEEEGVDFKEKEYMRNCEYIVLGMV